jgi:hypothetical protein
MTCLASWFVRPLVIGALAVAAAVYCVAVQAAESRPAAGLVIVDQAALRAAPRDGAPLLVPLWRGEALQLRGERGDWLQVWDPHRERGGFVRGTQVLALPAGDAALPDLAAQLRLLRLQPGAESLGIGVAAALIERAGPQWLASPPGAELLDTMIVLLDRLAQRAQTAGAAQQPTVAAQADVASRYGFALRSLPRADGALQLCPDTGPALLLRGHPAASASQQARAALALTRGDCPAQESSITRRSAELAQQAAWLDGIDATALVPVERNRLLLRRTSVFASLAFARREGDPQGAAASAGSAFAAWTQLIASELSDDDAPAVREAAIRLSPQRWLLQAPVLSRRLGRFEIHLERGGPGETCLVWHADNGAEPARRCSHGAVHLASARLAPDARTVVLAVQPLDGWTELWRLDANGAWQVLPPSSESPGLGAVEWAGWATSREGAQVLVAREADAGGRVLRRFEVYGPELTQPLRWAADPTSLGSFQRGADGAWRSASTIAR